MAVKPDIRVRLDPVPDKFRNDSEVWRFLNQLRDRVGGNSGNLIYDTVQDANTAAALEPLIFAISQEVENRVEGAVRSIIEQLQEQNIDISGLLTDTQDTRPEPEQPDDYLSIGGIIQAAISNAPVSSVFGRTGDVVAVEGDYDLTELGDVTLTAPASNQVLKYNGSVWINDAVPAGALSGIVPVANGGTGASTLTANNVILGNGTTAVTFVAPGTSGNVLTSNGTTWTSTAIPTQAPDYEEFVASAAQTVFNTTLTTTAKAAGKAYLQIFVNGIFQQEGATKEYTVTGATQITFNAGLALNDDVVIYSYT